jgi:AcrR family transcriptional regulator
MSDSSAPPRAGTHPDEAAATGTANELRDNGGNPASVWVKDALSRIDDPVASLPPTAQRVLTGAMRVVVSRGFGKLTLARISEESGENVAAVKYYFGNKAGLVSVMVDAVVYAELVLLTRPSGAESVTFGLSRLAEETLTLSEPGEPLRILFELLPHALRDRKLRQQLRGYYETFYSLHLSQLGAGEGADPDLRARMNGLVMLLAAVADGLTMQALVAPQHFDAAEALRAFDVLVTSGMPALLHDGIGRSEHPSEA